MSDGYPDDIQASIKRMQDMIPGREGAPESATQHDPGSDAWWDAHMRDKVRQWYASQPPDPSDTGRLAEFLGMTFAEFADWFGGGVVSDRVKRVWARR